MTRRGVALSVGAVGSWAVGRLLGIDEFYVVAIAAGVAVVLGGVAVLLSGSAIAVRRRVTRARLPAGEESGVVIELRNESRLPVPVVLGEDRCAPVLLEAGLQSRFVVPGLPHGSSVPAGYTVHGGLRGRYTIGPLTLRVRDPFGLVERTRRYRSTDELIVYPAIEKLPGGMSLGRHQGSGASRSRRLFNAGDEFHTMREYADGDDLRHVHWPSTAHRQTLMVRQNELSWDTQATVLCDTRAERHAGVGPASSLERAITVAASVVCHLDDHRYRTRLLTESDVRPPAHSTRDAALDRLAVLEATRHRSLEPVLGRLRSAEAEGLLVAILPAPPRGSARGANSQEITTLLQAGRSFSGRIAVVLDTGTDDSDERAAQLTALLSAAGWRATTLAPGMSVAAAWRNVVASRPTARLASAGGTVRTAAGGTAL